MEPTSAHGAELLGTFNNKHRTGLDGTLHRISVMTGTGGVVTGLTYRIGRHKEGAAPSQSINFNIRVPSLARLIGWPERVALCSIALGIRPVTFKV